ncbi:MAG: hypothetical protein AAGN66_12895 [Acidobacteriota bacterium]
MRLSPVYSSGPEGEKPLLGLPQPLDLDALLPGDGPWHVEIGYGKGKYLLHQAVEHPERRYLGIEIVSKYYRLLEGRARRRGVSNLVNVRGEALYLLSAVLPRAFAHQVHVYFPDPWPKARHHRRRLFDTRTLDLVLGALKPGGQLCFATDFLEYGELVMDLLAGYPDLVVEPLLGQWPGGPRTNYEAKFVIEGRPILRLVATLSEAASPGALHPGGVDGVVAAVATKDEDDLL